MRPPRTIWLFISRELWGLILLTTGVVVLIVAFCATVKPMAEGKLGSAEAARFLLYAIPPMLQYVLPFAAGFASTIAFHRMAADNELEAARVGGISYEMLLAPAAAAGLTLAAALALISGEVVPRFLRSMEDMIQQDLTRVLVNSVERGESVRFDDLLVFADSVRTLGPDERSGAYELLVLNRFAALALEKRVGDQGGGVRGGVTAARAWVWLRRDAESTPQSGGSTLVTIKLERASGDLPEVRGSFDESWITRRIPSPFRDDVKFMTWKQLSRLPKEPDLHAGVDSRRRALAFALARVEAISAIAAELQSQRRARLVNDSQTLLVRGAALVPRQQPREGEPPEWRWYVTPTVQGSPVDIEVMGGTTGLERLTARSVYLAPNADDPLDPRPALSLHLGGVRILADDGSAIENDIVSRDFRNLVPGIDPTGDLLKVPSRELLREADRRLKSRPDPIVADAARELRHRLKRLEHEVTGRVHERAAMSISCLVMVLTGCVTAIRLKERLPVPVYLWSFFPGIGAVLTVNAGKEMVRSMGEPGLILLWGGLLGLVGYAWAVYRGLRKH